ncbi:uncharacterized protein J3D65DRAFT_462596 [Phyllosticta citribraziliensis]|uniref:Uncharacterized protein n=1 Tax=Phyllosticta citribraziliensis TaxID=989973 RepID=A0ABR1LGV7_9PEZI
MEETSPTYVHQGFRPIYSGGVGPPPGAPHPATMAGHQMVPPAPQPMLHPSNKRTASRASLVAEPSSAMQKKEKKLKGKWTEEEEKLLIKLRSSGMKWVDISQQNPGRSATACRLRYQNYTEKKEWSEDEKDMLARLYHRFMEDMWKRIADEMCRPWRACERMHWQLGEEEMLRRANVQYRGTTSSNPSQLYHESMSPGSGDEQEQHYEQSPPPIGAPHHHSSYYHTRAHGMHDDHLHHHEDEDEGGEHWGPVHRTADFSATPHPPPPGHNHPDTRHGQSQQPPPSSLPPPSYSHRTSSGQHSYSLSHHSVPARTTTPAGTPTPGPLASHPYARPTTPPPRTTSAGGASYEAANSVPTSAGGKSGDGSGTTPRTLPVHGGLASPFPSGGRRRPGTAKSPETVSKETPRRGGREGLRDRSERAGFVADVETKAEEGDRGSQKEKK